MYSQVKQTIQQNLMLLSSILTAVLTVNVIDKQVLTSIVLVDL